MKGYQADIDAENQFTGQIYEERGRGFLAMRGQATLVPNGGPPRIIGNLQQTPDELKGLIKTGDWNQVHLIAHGNTITQILNGAVMSMLVDEDVKNRQLDGLIGFQMHVGPPMRSSSATSGSRRNEIVTAQFLAFDLGAESGRAMLGTLDGGVLSVREIHRFLNEPVRQNGSLQWDILHLWQEMRRALELNGRTRLDSVGVDSWGVDYALIGERGNLLENPYHYRDRRTTRRDGSGVRARQPRPDLRDHRHPVPADQHALSALRRLPPDAGPDRCRARARHHSRPAELLAHGHVDLRVHRGDDDPVHRCANADVGDAHAGGDWAADPSAAAAG